MFHFFFNFLLPLFCFFFCAVPIVFVIQPISVGDQFSDFLHLQIFSFSLLKRWNKVWRVFCFKRFFFMIWMNLINFYSASRPKLPARWSIKKQRFDRKQILENFILCDMKILFRLRVVGCTWGDVVEFGWIKIRTKYILLIRF